METQDTDLIILHVNILQTAIGSMYQQGKTARREIHTDIIENKGCVRLHYE